jgi:hypothetical protein
MAKAKLRQALAQYQGVDQKLEKQKKLRKQAERKKSKSNGGREEGMGEAVNEEPAPSAKGKHLSDSKEDAAEGAELDSDEEDGDRAVVCLN